MSNCRHAYSRWYSGKAVRSHGLRVMHYRRVTKGSVCRDVAMNWMYRMIRNDDSILVLNRIYVFIVIIIEAYSYWADPFFLLGYGNCVLFTIHHEYITPEYNLQVSSTKYGLKNNQ